MKRAVVELMAHCRDAFPNRKDDRLNERADIVTYIRCLEANDLVPIVAQTVGAKRVREFLILVMGAVDLDDELRLRASEIDNVVTYGVLPAEFQICVLAVA